MRIRPACCGALVLALALTAREARAQAAVVSDLWRVAEGTLVGPPALAEGGSAALWTPAVVLATPQEWGRLGIEAVHSPADIGLNGGVGSLSLRVGRLGTLSAVYARLGYDGLVRTETSPEGIGSIPVYAEAVSLGFARELEPGLVAGLALRSLAGQLDVESRTQLGVDVGLRYSDRSHVTIAVATRFFDPTLRAAEQAASYDFGCEYRSLPSPMWGTIVVVRVRYGAGLSHGQGLEQWLSGGVALGPGGVAEVDAGAAREVVTGVAVWRSKFGLSVKAGAYRVYLGRDGGVNGFGASYRFGLTVELT